MSNSFARRAEMTLRAIGRREGESLRKTDDGYTVLNLKRTKLLKGPGLNEVDLAKRYAGCSANTRGQEEIIKSILMEGFVSRLKRLIN